MPLAPRPTLTPTQPAGNFFGGIDYTDPDSIAKGVGAGAQALDQRGQTLSATGMDALSPVLGQLMKLFSGDENAIGDATRPQVKGVLDQYDAARRSIAQFAPRGGGRETALATSRFSEASDIGNIRSNAVTSATQQLSTIGASLLNAGENEQTQSLSSLMGLLQNAQQDKSNSAALWSQIGIHAGKLAAAWFTGGASVAVVGV